MQSTFPGQAGQDATRDYLMIDTPDQIIAMLELWDKHSGATGLLGSTLDIENAGSYRYDQETQTYTNTKTGRPVTRDQLDTYIRRVSSETSNRMKKNTQQLISGIIILAVWYDRQRDLMRALYKTIWLLSIGGFVFDDPFYRNLFYLFVLLQFEYLDNFSRQLNDGRQAMNGQAMNRAGMYGEYGNTLWQNIWLDRAEELGYEEARRVLGDNENHCHDDGDRPGCIELADQGWIPVQDMTPIGDAVCYTNCHCKIEYR